jgi:hypothetical protein
MASQNIVCEVFDSNWKETDVWSVGCHCVYYNQYGNEYFYWDDTTSIPSIWEQNILEQLKENTSNDIEEDNYTTHNRKQKKRRRYANIDDFDEY